MSCFWLRKNPTPESGIRARCHCERSEAIFAQKQRLLRRLSLLAMTVSSPLFLCSPRVLSHGPKLDFIHRQELKNGCVYRPFCHTRSF